jgi:hypothetical protein
MKLRENTILFTFLVVFLILGASVAPVAATVSWSDDFSDGDYSGWTILQGSFITPSAPRYYLSGGSSSPDWIHHPSTQVVGTWLFEMYEDGIIEDELEVLFMATGTNYTNFEGYAVDLFYGISTYGITLERWNYSSTFDRSARFPGSLP